MLSKPVRWSTSGFVWLSVINLTSFVLLLLLLGYKTCYDLIYHLVAILQIASTSIDGADVPCPVDGWGSRLTGGALGVGVESTFREE